MIQKVVPYFEIEEQEINSSDQYMVRCSGMNKKDKKKKISKVIYLPEQLNDFLSEHTTGPSSACCVALIDYAVQQLIKNNKKISAFS